MDTLTRCLQERHNVQAELIHSWFHICGVTLGSDEDGQPVAVVGFSEPWSSDNAGPSVVEWKCHTCQAGGEGMPLEIDCR